MVGRLWDFVRDVVMARELGPRLRETEAKIAVLRTKISSLEAENLDLEKQVKELREENEVLKKPHEPGMPRWGSQPRIKGRTEI